MPRGFIGVQDLVVSSDLIPKLLGHRKGTVKGTVHALCRLFAAWCAHGFTPLTDLTIQALGEVCKTMVLRYPLAS